MREIKFRGIAIDTGEFVYGYLMHSEQDDIYYIGTTELMTPVKPKTIGQFTGLYDKHGIEVFEGDIVRVVKESKFRWKHDPVEEVASIAYINQLGRYYSVGDAFDNLNDFMFRNTENNQGEVIGNIHQNSNLLYECPQNT